MRQAHVTLDYRHGAVIVWLPKLGLRDLLKLFRGQTLTISHLDEIELSRLFDGGTARTGPVKCPLRGSFGYVTPNQEVPSKAVGSDQESGSQQ